MSSSLPCVVTSHAVIVIAWQEDPSALQPVPLNKVPVLSFEEAAKPLLDTVPDLTAKLADCRKLIGENRALIPKEVHASASSGYYVCTTAACPWQVGDDGAAAPQAPGPRPRAQAGRVSGQVEHDRTWPMLAARDRHARVSPAQLRRSQTVDLAACCDCHARGV